MQTLWNRVKHLVTEGPSKSTEFVVTTWYQRYQTHEVIPGPHKLEAQIRVVPTESSLIVKIGMDGSDGSSKRFFNRAQIYIMFGVGLMLGTSALVSRKTHYYLVTIGILSIFMLYNREFSSVTSIRADELATNLRYTESNLVSVGNKTKEIIFDTNLLDNKTKEKSKQHAILRLFNCTIGGNVTASFAKCNPAKRRRSKSGKIDIEEKLASITTSIVTGMKNHSGANTTTNIVGGCSGTRYGCCLDTKIPKADKKGSNCG